MILLLPLFAAGWLTLAPLGTDDLVPQALEALLATPDDPVEFGIPVAAPGSSVFQAPGGVRTGRALADVGDVNGDGASDLALGYAPLASAPGYEVVDGRSGETLWTAASPAGFRWSGGLAALDGDVIAAGEARQGRVVRRDGATGARVWSSLLAPGPGLVSLYAVAVVDGDVLVGGGRGYDGVARLAGSDGALRWNRSLGGPVLDVQPLAGGDILAVGGNALPFAARLTAAGSVLWQVPLPGPGAVGREVDDVDGDQIGDVVVGLFNAPGPCLVALSGADGATLWTTSQQFADVTSLALASDVDEDGLPDVAVGSFDNAMGMHAVASGLRYWRREVSTYEGGHVLSVAAAGDLDGNGSIDLYATGFDHRAYVFGSIVGQLMSVTPVRDRAVVGLALGDGDADGRPEFAVAGRRTLAVIDGASGLASGPKLVIDGYDSGETSIHVFAYPSTSLYVFYARQTASLTIPGFAGTLGLLPATLVPVYAGNAPGAGISGFVLGPFPEFIPHTLLYAQAVTVYASGTGAFSNAEEFLAGR